MRAGGWGVGRSRSEALLLTLPWAAQTSASVPRRSTGVSALPREPNDFILMGQRFIAGDEVIDETDPNGSDEFIYLRWVNNLRLGRC